MPFDQDAELDPRLSGITLAALFSKYEQQFAGNELTAAMKQHSQAPDDAKAATRIDKAIKAALADLELLVGAVASEGSDEVPAEVEVGNDKLLLEIYWRLHDGWKAEAAPAVKMIDVADGAPAWTDVRALFGELEAIDHDAGDGDSFPTEWYEELLARYEARLGKDKPKKVGAKKASARKPPPPIKTPPPDAQIVDYSSKGTFLVGQWVRHPKFGVGYVIDSSQHVTLEFGPDTKMLAHVAALPPPVEPKHRRSMPSSSTLDLARAAGIEIKKVPARVEDEK